MAEAEAPTFFLYGEAPRAVTPGFLHLEPLAARSRPSGWSIRLHRHADLNHIFLISGGGGEIATSTGRLGFSAPCLLFIPAQAAHGFSFHLDSFGHVLTVASSFLDGRPACREIRLALFECIRALPCGAAAPMLQDAFSNLAHELAWTAPGHDAAVEGAVLTALVGALRAEAGVRERPGRDAALVARFREEVEARFRERPPLEVYADNLGVSLSRLHQACRTVARSTPLGLVQARLRLEAERALLYSDMTVADVGLSLGFEDAAYFSRFFTKQTGTSPSAFRSSGPTGDPTHPSGASRSHG